ncbi:MAG: Gfo/Idh/MocA family oxidoreductase [Alphaproteobacteria bacterium]|nr:Gfo/Idh/MocA family oxidoreductase [Alphaproteobacteria bacterium]
MTVRIGILGAGAMGGVHAAAYGAIDGVSVVGMLSGNEVRAGIDALLAEVDAIDVCLPSAVHRPPVVAALNAGRHVFCETPLALALEDAQAMRDAARRAGRLLQVGLLMRSVDAYRTVKDAVVSGMHGRLLTLSTWRLGSYLHPDAPNHKAHYGDPTTELMTFDLDFIQWVMGRPARVSANASGEVTAMLAFADGRHATVTASGLMPPGSPFTVGFRALFEKTVVEHEIVFAGEPPKGRNPYEVELRRFVDCIAGRADPDLLDVDRAIEALELSLDIQRALKG